MAFVLHRVRHSRTMRSVRRMLCRARPSARLGGGGTGFIKATVESPIPRGRDPLPPKGPTFQGSVGGGGDHRKQKKERLAIFGPNCTYAPSPQQMSAVRTFDSDLGVHAR